MSDNSSRRRVAVTGFGMITPLGRNTTETFDRASNGLSGIDYIKSFETNGLPCRVGGEVDDQWIEELLPQSARRLQAYSSRGLRLMSVATREAAGLARLDLVSDRTRIGVSLGSHGDNPSVEDISLLHRFYDGKGNWDIRGLMDAGGYSCLNFFRRKPDAAPALLSMLFDCKGPNLSFVSACSAGAQAIGEAYRIIREGSADVMIAGGCEATLNFTGFIGFVLIKALVEKYATPPQASRPFDRKRNGFVMSEGAGSVILEDLDHARSRGVPILGEILGYGDSADAYRITDTHPKGDGAILAMQGAMDDAGIGIGEIDYINAHGTSTVQNDLTETRAIKAVFGDRARQVPVSSNKSMIGHTIAAAGAIECILTLTGMHRSIILPTINQENPDPKCDLDYVPNEARSRRYRRALSNSFGFGGQNACLCIGSFEE
ncbi:MAG: beta-ketoacyl-[acyl-carrier-protein] synthase family protein [Nitrospiraceae bacterium]|nr:beta-ketoacyl-[acyl-carrier-protein] synthase family protein [Nitrospiraceae bacterium]